jgi:hypothetical protein
MMHFVLIQIEKTKLDIYFQIETPPRVKTNANAYHRASCNRYAKREFENPIHWLNLFGDATLMISMNAEQ